MKDCVDTQTCLFKNETVRKDHPRIVLRGALDTLLAQTVWCQVEMARAGHDDIKIRLDVLIDVIRALQIAEYSGEAIDIRAFDCVDWEEMHRMSHRPMAYFGIPHPTITADMGTGVAALNLLRAHIRECERAAVAAFDGGREDIVHALNRMSSYAYVLLCTLCAKGADAS